MNETSEPISSLSLKDISIRPIIRSELPELEWEGEYSRFRFSYAQTFERTITGQSLMWVIVLNQKDIIGQVFIQLHSDRPELADGKIRAYLYAFRIREKYRSMGIGAIAMDFVEEDLRGRGYQIITLNVAKDNYGAQRLYQRRGYRITANEPGIWSYIDNNGIIQQVEEPAWRMEKQLV